VVRGRGHLGRHRPGSGPGTPLQLARALSGIASGGYLRRPHLVFPDELPPDTLSAVQSTYPGSGDRTIPLTPENWETITDAMAATLGPGGTGGAVHLEGIDFAGKTGTAQVVNHSAGATSLGAGKERANAWFVGMAPRRNPDIVVAVLCEHGGWGAEAAAPLAARVINAFVEKQRKRSGNIRVVDAPAPKNTPNLNGLPTAAAMPATRPGELNPPAINQATSN
jgi:penicillin-binding protein 2